MRLTILLMIGHLIGSAGLAQDRRPKAAPHTGALTENSRRQAAGVPLEKLLRGPVNDQVLREMRNAWFVSGGGMDLNEIVILVFRANDGSLTARTQEFTSHPRASTFRWSPGAVAILHTHPNVCDPKPSGVDRQTADRLHVPIVTMTSRGLHVYDPATGFTEELIRGLEWLKPGSWSMELSLVEPAIASNRRVKVK